MVIEVEGNIVLGFNQKTAIFVTFYSYILSRFLGRTNITKIAKINVLRMSLILHSDVPLQATRVNNIVSPLFPFTNIPSTFSKCILIYLDLSNVLYRSSLIYSLLKD